MDHLIEQFVNNFPVLQALIIAPVAMFFQVPIFWVLITLVVLDIYTGLRRAHLIKNINSSKFSDSLDRIVGYVIIFSALHMISLLITGPITVLAEFAIMSGYCLKEFISILENIKAIDLVNGRTNQVTDLLISKLGVDLNKILEQIGQKKDGNN